MLMSAKALLFGGKNARNEKENFPFEDFFFGFRVFLMEMCE